MIEKMRQQRKEKQKNAKEHYQVVRNRLSLTQRKRESQLRSQREELNSYQENKWQICRFNKIMLFQEKKQRDDKYLKREQIRDTKLALKRAYFEFHKISRLLNLFFLSSDYFQRIFNIFQEIVKDLN